MTAALKSTKLCLCNIMDGQKDSGLTYLNERERDLEHKVYRNW